MAKSFYIGITTVFLYGCISEDDVAVSMSPDGSITAILEERNGGATTSFGYNVYLKGIRLFDGRTKVASLYGATRSDCAYGINLVWESASILNLEYDSALNVVLEPTTTNIHGTEYQVNLRPDVYDETAPCGGMLYNLQNKGNSVDA